MPGIVGIIGVIPFCGGLHTANTFHEISKTTKNVFVKHRIINGNDLLEDCGVEPIDLDIQMKVGCRVHGGPRSVAVSLGRINGGQDSRSDRVGGVPLGRPGSLLTLFVIESIGSKMTKWKGSLLVELECAVKVCEFGNPLSIAGPLGALVSAGASVIGRLI